MFLPKALQKGDTVAITAASGPVNAEKLSDGIKILESMGFNIIVTESCFLTHEYFAGTDRQRLNDLHTAFADKNVRAIFMARGGYGAARLLPYLNRGLIEENPKIVAGYSDVTALHIYLNQCCGLITFHAPMPAADLPSADAWTLSSFKNALMSNTYPNDLKLSVIQKGYAAGILIGGNLTLITASLGTPYEIDTRGKILFIEETNEPPYRVDRMFVQLKQAGKLRDAAGFLLGDFSPEHKIKLAVSELLIPEGKPILCGLPCGHTMPNITLPLGQNVQISTELLHPLQICCR